MERRYAGRAEFVLLYTREYNPGIGRFRDVTDPTTLEGRLTLARRLKADFDAAGRHPVWVVDSMANRLHEAYGSPKGASIVVDRGGRVLFKGAWASPAAVEQALAPAVARAQAMPHDVDAGFFVSLEPEARPRAAPAAGRADGLWVDIGGATKVLASAPPRPPAPPAHVESPVLAAPPAPSPRAFTFGVAGMVCQGCAISVREAVQQVPHVASAKLAYQPGVPGQLHVETDADVPPEAIRRAVVRTGFSVVSGP